RSRLTDFGRRAQQGLVRGPSGHAVFAPDIGERHSFRQETRPFSPKMPHRDLNRGFWMLNKRSGYEYEDLLACARGEMFGPGNAQLPLPPMLMFDRITEIADSGGEFGKGVVRAELDVKPDLWFFGCHFKNDPVMPGCLGLDALWQMVGFYLGWIGGEGRGRALGLSELKFGGQVLPEAR